MLKVTMVSSQNTKFEFKTKEKDKDKAVEMAVDQLRKLGGFDKDFKLFNVEEISPDD